MKKLSLIFAFVLLIAAMFAINIFAAHQNIIGEATTDYTGQHWHSSMSSYWWDGDPTTTTAGPKSCPYTITIDYDSLIEFSKVHLVVNGPGKKYNAWGHSVIEDGTFAICEISIEFFTRNSDDTYTRIDEACLMNVDTSALYTLTHEKTVQAHRVAITVTNTVSWDYSAPYEVEVYGFMVHECDYQRDSYVKIPTCAEDGLANYSCTICHETEQRVESATGNHDIQENIYFKDGFTNPGFKGSACTGCATQNQPGEEIGPLFQTLGYSASEAGKSGVSLTILVNHENIAVYNSLSAVPLQFGVVAATRAALPESNPLFISDTGITKASNAVVTKDFTESGYSTISYKLQGFSADHNGTELIVSAYIFDGANIYYLGEETTENVATTSFNDIMGIVDTSVEAIVPKEEE